MNDKEFSRLTQFYLENFGPLVPHIGEELGHMKDNHPVELILEALKKALEANATNKIRYANTILTNWKNQLLITLDEVKAADQRRTNSFATQKGAKVEVVSEWFNKQSVASNPTHEILDIAAEREQLQKELQEMSKF